MEQVQVFKEILNQIGSGQGTFRESGEQGRTLMDVVRQLPSSDVKGECLKSFLDVILRESFNIVSARQYLNEFVTGVNDLDAEMQKMVISYALDKMQSRSISFEEQMYPLRLRLAAELEREQNWLQAARVLSQIPLESGQKQYTKENKMDLYLQIGRLFLEAEEFTEAENYIHRLGLLIDSAASEEIRSSLQHLKHKHLVEVAKSSMDRLIVSLGKPCDLTEQFAKVMDLIRGLPDNHAKEECLEHFLNTILRESFNVISARQYLEEFATSVYDLDAETRKSVLKYALSKSTSAFKEQMFKLQLLLADVLEDEQNWREAAYVLVLTEFPEQPVLERIKLYRRKVRLLLAGGDFGLAESCNATLGLLLQGDPTIPEEFRAFHATSFASIQNFKRQNNN